MNGHAIGIILKELVRRAILTIRNERHVFEATIKEGYSGNMDDVLTSADTKAQAVYLKSLTECFPEFGVIAEDGAARMPAGVTTYFTVDPLDGTRAFVRRQSHGVGTMVALVDCGAVISAYIGDVSTQEIYGFRPGSKSVHRISEYETSEKLGWADKPLGEQYVILRDLPGVYTEASQRLLSHFKSFEVEGGSIGTWLARLWKREVGAALIPAGVQTPWDATPIIGMSKALQYCFWRPSSNGLWELYEPVIKTEICRRDHDILIIHRRDVRTALRIMA